MPISDDGLCEPAELWTSPSECKGELSVSFSSSIVGVGDSPRTEDALLKGRSNWVLLDFVVDVFDCLEARFLRLPTVVHGVDMELAIVRVFHDVRIVSTVRTDAA